MNLTELAERLEKATGEGAMITAYRKRVDELLGNIAVGGCSLSLSEDYPMWRLSIVAALIEARAAGAAAQREADVEYLGQQDLYGEGLNAGIEWAGSALRAAPLVTETKDGD